MDDFSTVQPITDITEEQTTTATEEPASNTQDPAVLEDIMDDISVYF